ncbi:unnamed protein product [Vicia faba]|uniref:Uncharacterized protein n=1 Tax=Vicia faba TaxID=3906 RepID=A0AAV1A924_VICFA|nr:unnamed protein product [Vicia faba]
MLEKSVAYSDFISFYFGFHRERAENVLIVERDGWKLDVAVKDEEEDDNYQEEVEIADDFDFVFLTKTSLNLMRSNLRLIPMKNEQE